MTHIRTQAWRTANGCSNPAWEVSPASARPALEALDRLWDRIHEELQLYREHVAAVNDEARLEWAGWAENWLKTKGVELRRELSDKITNAAASDHEDMTQALQAAQELVDVTHEYLNCPEAWDTILDWARGILPSLKRAFRRFRTSEILYDKVEPELPRYAMEGFVTEWAGAGVGWKLTDDASQHSEETGHPVAA